MTTSFPIFSLSDFCVDAAKTTQQFLRRRRCLLKSLFDWFSLSACIFLWLRSAACISESVRALYLSNFAKPRSSTQINNKSNVIFISSVCLAFIFILSLSLSFTAEIRITIVAQRMSQRGNGSRIEVKQTVDIRKNFLYWFLTSFTRSDLHLHWVLFFVLVGLFVCLFALLFFVSLFYQIWMPFARIPRKNRKMCTRRLSHSIPTICDFSLNEHLNRLHTVHRSLFHTLCWLFNKSLSIYKMSIIIISGVDLRDALLFSRTGIRPNMKCLFMFSFCLLRVSLFWNRAKQSTRKPTNK